jgi:hypothetical protein
MVSSKLLVPWAAFVRVESGRWMRRGEVGWTVLRMKRRVLCSIFGAQLELQL